MNSNQSNILNRVDCGRIKFQWKCLENGIIGNFLERSCVANRMRKRKLARSSKTWTVEGHIEICSIQQSARILAIPFHFRSTFTMLGLFFIAVKFYESMKMSVFDSNPFYMETDTLIHSPIFRRWINIFSIISMVFLNRDNFFYVLKSLLCWFWCLSW